jgi:hypothetical protein
MGAKTACREDPAAYRQHQCIKKAFRMYPPAPFLWPRRFAKKDLEIPNPISSYDERKKPPRKVLSTRMLSKLTIMGSTAPIECKKNIKFLKETIAIMVFP